jgi:hypothetical protein
MSQHCSIAHLPKTYCVRVAMTVRQSRLSLMLTRILLALCAFRVGEVCTVQAGSFKVPPVRSAPLKMAHSRCAPWRLTLMRMAPFRGERHK